MARTTRRKTSQKSSKKGRRPKRVAERKDGGCAAADGPSVPEADELLNMDQAIELLKTTRPTFYRWLRAGKLQGMKVGRQWRFQRKELERFLKGEEPQIELRADIGHLLQALREAARKLKARATALPADTPLQQAVKLMIEVGLAHGASDMHLEPHLKSPAQNKVAILRYRTDGLLHSPVEFDIRLLPPIMACWKAMGACDPKETKRPQHARMCLDGPETDVVDLRLCFLPAGLGESLSVATLHYGPHETPRTLEDIDYAPADRDRLLRCLQAPWGLLVFSGPAGSGMTSSMYACLKHLARPDRRIASIEDPIAYYLPWVSQLQVGDAEGLTYAKLLDSLMYSCPNYVMVGEMPDLETLERAQSAALSGHGVISRLHCADAVHALVRMIQMGADPFVLGESTRLIVAQRLVMRLCENCSQEERLSAYHLVQAERIARAGGVDWRMLPRGFRKPVGCPKCKRSGCPGYLGRTVIAEMLQITPEIGQALARGDSDERLRSVAIQQGMTSMAADGVRKAAEGKTTLNELLRVLGHQLGQ